MCAPVRHICCGGTILERCSVNRYCAGARLLRAVFRLDVMLHNEGGLRQGEQEDQGNDPPYLEGNPGRRRCVTPDNFIGDGQCDEEKTPAPGQLPPACLCQFKGLRENIFYKEAIEGEPPKQGC